MKKIAHEVQAWLPSCTFHISNFKLPNDPWGSSDEELQEYYAVKWAIAKSLKVASVLEFGVRAGYSAAAFLNAGVRRYIGIDLNTGTDGGEQGYVYQAMGILPNAFPRSQVTIWADRSSHDPIVLAKCNDHSPFDLVHVDGDHSYEGAMQDMYMACLLGRYVLVDDCERFGTVKRAVRDFIESTGYEVEYFPSLTGEAVIRGLRP
jgi:hypothetical protein